MLIYSSRSSVFAAPKESPRDVCLCLVSCTCNNDPENLAAVCCGHTEFGDSVCEKCDVNTDTGDFENCVVFHKKPPTTGGVNVPTNSGVLQQPPPKHSVKDNAKVPTNDGGVNNPRNTQPPTNNPPPGL
jgi:hypothetical protein